jgi:hypothetical protein
MAVRVSKLRYFLVIALFAFLGSVLAGAVRAHSHVDEAVSGVAAAVVFDGNPRLG